MSRAASRPESAPQARHRRVDASLELRESFSGGEAEPIQYGCEAVPV